MAEYCRAMFGDMLLTEPLDKFPASGLLCGTPRAGAGVGAGEQGHGGGQVNHASGAVLGLGGGCANGKGAVPALRRLPGWWGERGGPWPGQQWLLWEHPGVLNWPGPEKGMAKLSPRSEAGFVLVVRSAGQTEQERENRSEEWGRVGPGSRLARGAVGRGRLQEEAEQVQRCLLACSLCVKDLRLLPAEEERVLIPPPLPQLKPGSPLPSPEDLRGKILIKNKKNQFAGLASPSGEAEGSCPPSAPVGGDAGESARRSGAGGGWEGGSGLGEGLGLESRPGVGPPPPLPPELMELCVAVLAGEEGAELEEEDVGEEEEEESGNLDEEEMKKMQSDEVCGDSPGALLPPPLGGRPGGPRPRAPGSSSPPSSPPRARRAWR